MSERKGLSAEIRAREGNGQTIRIAGGPLFTIVGVIVLWVAICSGAWFVWAQPDYANLRTATHCYGSTSAVQSSDLICKGIRPPAAHMAEVDRKAFISRLASAGGTAVGLIIFLILRGRVRSLRSTRPDR